MKRKSKKKTSAKRGTARKPTRKVAARKKARRASTNGKPRAAAAAAMPGDKSRNGVITHTELASSDPIATRTWCQQVLGWKFEEAPPSPMGPYYMWRFPLGTGGGIRGLNGPESPGSTPYCEVADIKTAFSKALAAGATPMFPPEALPGGMGWIAIVTAPGGVAIGFWSMK